MSKQAADFAIAVHPGDVLQEMLDERSTSQMDLARHLSTDVARINEICRRWRRHPHGDVWRHPHVARINEICRRRRGISAVMAVMLAKAFGTSPGLWMNLQKNWELSQVDARLAKQVKPLRKSA